VVVPPGTGWPDDPATSATPVAVDPEQVRVLAAGADSLAALAACSSVCRACPRLVAWREDVAANKRRAFAGQPYWGRPVPGWGDAAPSIVVVGLAPAAHGGNRTGRIFTGDRSGDWLFAALHRAGLATRPTSTRAGDGQRLLGARLVATVRCAPPANRPTPDERDACRPWLARELALVRPSLRALVVLGGFAWQALWPALDDAGYPLPARRPAFRHGAELLLPGADTGAGDLVVIACYHPSQQNTFTGKLTADMLDVVFARAAAHVARAGSATTARVPSTP
jgi:uracil-DNA glycosylase family 4